MELPGYIFQILENEFQQMQMEWLKKISDRYSIDLEELKETCLEPLKINRIKLLRLKSFVKQNHVKQLLWMNDVKHVYGIVD